MHLAEDSNRKAQPATPARPSKKSVCHPFDFSAPASPMIWYVEENRGISLRVTGIIHSAAATPFLTADIIEDLEIRHAAALAVF